LVDVTKVDDAGITVPLIVEGIRLVSKVPDVILLAAKSGILPVSKVPDVILLAAKSGIRLVSNMPDVILAAVKSGTSVDDKVVPLVTRPKVSVVTLV
jgi:hypothetical protein